MTIGASPVKRRRSFVRIVRNVLLVLLVLGAGGWLAIRRWLAASAPRTEGTIEVAGPTDVVEVVRDRYGTVRIDAESQVDAFFALGFVHAQDRFFQMDLSRRVPEGRLAELVGRPAAERDRRLRKLGLYPAAQRSLDALEPETRAALNAYTAGVNAWLADGGQRLPPEYDVLHMRGAPARPEPWRPADSVVILKYLSLILDGNMSSELHHGELVEQVGEVRASALESTLAPWGDTTDIIPTSSVSPTPPAATPLPAEHGARALSADEEGWVGLVQSLGGGPGIGSNSWVISGARTKSGFPLLSNDPHLAVQSPSQWYAVRIHAPGLAVEGATAPGIPFVMLGRNEHIAWGITALHADVEDVFVEKVDPADSRFYLVDGKREPFTIRQERIVVAGGAPIDLEVKATRHGPVFEDDWRHKGPVALSWIALAEDDTSLDALFGLDKARSWSEFLAAARRVVAPVVNFTYADVDGHIAYLVPGRIPIRGSGEGQSLVDGSRADAIWKGFVPFDELPRVVDPAEGFIVSANQRPVGPGFAHYLGNEWASPFRAQRIREILTSRDKISVDDLPQIHADVQSTLAKRLLPKLAAITSKEPMEIDALQRIKTWDGSLAGDSAAAIVYERWILRAQERIFKDDVDAATLTGLIGGQQLLVALDEPGEAWCDDAKTAARETCAEQLSASLQDAVADVVARLGRDPAGWRLDRWQKVVWSPPVMGQVPLIGSRFVRRAGVGGDETTVRVAAHDGDLSVGAISSMFGDYDLAPGGGARLTVALGQSGHVASPHFDDLVELWRQSKAVPLDAPATLGQAHLRIVPKSTPTPISR